MLLYDKKTHCFNQFFASVIVEKGVRYFTFLLYLVYVFIHLLLKQRCW